MAANETPKPGDTEYDLLQKIARAMSRLSGDTAVAPRPLDTEHDLWRKIASGADQISG